MIPRRLAAQATVGSFAVTAAAAFLLHWPCRNSGYLEDRFTSFCYTDLAPILATGDVLQAWTELPPVPQYLVRAVAALPLDWSLQLVVIQLLLAAALLAVGLVAFAIRQPRPLDAALLLLLPIWPLVMLVSTDLISVAFTAVGLMLWVRGHRWAGLFAGLALASGAWTWLLLLVAWVDAYRSLAIRRFAGFAVSALAVALAANLPRLLSGQSLLQPLDLAAGEGSGVFIISLLNPLPETTAVAVWAAGLIGIFATAWWAAQLEFDFRLEALLAVMVGIQLLTGLAIEPQSLTHLVWLLPLVWPRRSTLLKVCGGLALYVVVVWLHKEALQPAGKGAHDAVYAAASAIGWLTIGYCISLARNVMVVQGIDVVAQAANTTHRHGRAARSKKADA